MAELKGETWSFDCNMIVENVTLEPACWGLNSDSTTYCVALGEGDTHREDGHMKMVAESGVMLPQTKEWQILLTSTRSWKRQAKILP